MAVITSLVRAAWAVFKLGVLVVLALAFLLVLV